MIDIIVSKSCPACEQQLKLIGALDRDSYRIIEHGSKEFEALPEKNLIDIVPFIISRSANGKLRSVWSGVAGPDDLSRLAASARTEPFNLSRKRASS